MFFERENDTYFVTYKNRNVDLNILSEKIIEFFKSEKHIQLKDELIEKAIMNAKAKAENALAPLGYSIMGVKAVSLSEFGMYLLPMPMPMFNMAFDESMEGSFAASSTHVFSSDQYVSTTANVIFLIGSN
ncbi:MAG: SIMPL domain-containing protein [Nitrosopumilus sp.]